MNRELQLGRRILVIDDEKNIRATVGRATCASTGTPSSAMIFTQGESIGSEDCPSEC
jgi:hypothetical protein